MSDNNQEMLHRLDILIRLVASGVCAGRSQKEKIAILGAAGLGSREIAEFLGTTTNTVSVALSSLRRESRRPSRPGSPGNSGSNDE